LNELRPWMIGSVLYLLSFYFIFSAKISDLFSFLETSAIELKF